MKIKSILRMADFFLKATSYLQVGDYVVINNKPHILWQIVQELPSEDERKFKIFPYDPVQKQAVGLVLYKNNKPVDYSEWCLSNNKSINDHNFRNEFTEQNGGAKSFDWIRYFTIRESLLLKVDPAKINL